MLPAKLLLDHRRIVVIGMSATSGKDAHDVPAYLAANGYEIVPVNPSGATILGAPARRSLDEVAGPLGLVAVFRPGPETPRHVEAALARGASAIWLPTDVASAESRALAEEAGVPFVEDVCLRTVHSLHVRARRQT